MSTQLLPSPRLGEHRHSREERYRTFPLMNKNAPEYHDHHGVSQTAKGQKFLSEEAQSPSLPLSVVSFSLSLSLSLYVSFPTRTPLHTPLCFL